MMPKHKVITDEDRFNFALDFLLEDEGGYSNDEYDSGGETNFGITQRELNYCYEELNLPKNVKDLNREDAYHYYKCEWWDHYDYNDIENIIVARKILDLSVNMGPSSCHRIVQESLIEIGYPDILVDGILGPQTLDAINKACSSNKTSSLLDEIKYGAKCHYQELVNQNPSLEKFLNGWLCRAVK